MEQTQPSNHYHGTRVSDRGLLVQGNIYYNVVLLIVEEEWARYRSLRRQVHKRHRRKATRPTEHKTYIATNMGAEGLDQKLEEARILDGTSGATKSASEDEIVQRNFRQCLNARAHSVYQMFNLPKSLSNVPNLSLKTEPLQTSERYFAEWNASVFFKENYPSKLHFHHDIVFDARILMKYVQVRYGDVRSPPFQVLITEGQFDMINPSRHGFIIPLTDSIECRLKSGSRSLIAFCLDTDEARSYMARIEGLRHVGSQFTSPSYYEDLEFSDRSDVVDPTTTLSKFFNEQDLVYLNDNRDGYDDAAAWTERHRCYGISAQPSVADLLTEEDLSDGGVDLGDLHRIGAEVASCW